MRPLCGFALACLFAPTVLFAQQVPAPATGETASVDTLHVTKQIAILDLVVTDRKGNLVTDCTAKDFSVYENGMMQHISHFEAPSADGKLPDTAPKDHNGRDDWGSAPLTMLVIDEMNTPFSEIAYSRYEVNRFLKAQPALMDEPTMVLWLNDSGFHALTPFTRDREALLTSVKKHDASLASKLLRGEDVERLAASFSALQQIALFSRGAPGSKKIIWIGRGFPGVNTEALSAKQQDILTRAIHSTLDLLLASRISVDVVDPTELYGTNTTPITTIGGEGNDVTADAALAIDVPDPFAATFNFGSFIEQTGGQYFFGRNDIDREIASSAKHADSFYTITYSPSQVVEDGKYRKIYVRMSNPNLIVQTKQGYYPGGMDTSTPTRKELGFDLYEASVTGMVYTGVGLSLRKCARDVDRIHATCNLSVDLGTLSFDPATDGRYVSSFIVTASSLDQKAKLLYWTTDAMKLGVASADAGKIAGSIGILTIRTVVPPQARTVRFIVRDSSGRIGTADLPSGQTGSLSVSVAALQELRKQHRSLR